MIHILGGAHLDFREALLLEGVTEVTIYSILAGARIIVPPDISVDAQTYEVRADGELLVCDPARELPLAQKYFLF